MRKSRGFMQNPHTFRRTFLVAIAGIVVVGAVNALRAQAPETKPPTFEVASVKPSTTGSQTRSEINFGGRYTATNMSPLALIRTAYRLQGFQLVGAPGWLGTQHFDIVAKADGDLFPSNVVSNTPRPLDLALRGLLADRFQLVAHNETRQLPIYALVVARTDGRLGSNLIRSTTDCVAFIAAAIAAARGGHSPPAPVGDQAPPCSARSGLGRLSGNSLALAQLAGFLAPFVDRAVVDRTDLTGIFNFDLTWTPDQPSPNTVNADERAVTPSNVTSIFTAVQEQLGLKLEPTKGPVDVLVIDHVEQPTPD
jgi:uncharacterized protein (TIGR03435 family)